MNEVLYREVQYFRQPLFWMLLFGVGIGVLGGAAYYFVAWRRLRASHPEASGTWPAVLLGACLLFVAALYALFLTANLTTEVRADGVRVRLFPLQLSFREISLEGVERVEATTYRPLRDYGGWGLRLSSKGRAYSVSGHRGVLVNYAEDQRSPILIGSREPERLAAAIEQIRSRR